jgi:hypothetical protein
MPGSNRFAIRIGTIQQIGGGELACGHKRACGSFGLLVTNAAALQALELYASSAYPLGCCSTSAGHNDSNWRARPSYWRLQWHPRQVQRHRHEDLHGLGDGAKVASWDFPIR